MNHITDDKMNVIIFLTDQERATQNFPENWEENNLPGLTRLKKNGLTFTNAFTNSCMCSPARSTFMSGVLPATHGVKYTLEEDMDAENYDQVELPLPPNSPRESEGMKLKNIATVMSAAGYDVVYKGKWHCSKPANSDGDWDQQDLADYGFSRWNPKDAGANQTLEEAAGAPNKNDQTDQPWNNNPGGLESDYHNDARFMYDDEGEQKEGVLAYLDYVKANLENPNSKPFCLIISLVNPHDVLFLGNDTFDQAGYGDSENWVNGDITTPDSMESDDLSTKPEVQGRFLNLSVGLGNLSKPGMKTDYVNFYGNLIKSSDAYLVKVLDKLDALKMTEDTLVIRTSDHGEMGLAHGGLRQKNFNFYEESIRIPMVYSNPSLFNSPQSSDELISHVDFLPTLANLVEAPTEARSEKWEGIDYSSLIIPPTDNSPKFVGQEYIVFTYDDWQAGQNSPPYAGQSTPINPTVAPNHIVGIREKRYKFAEYYDAGNFSDDLVDSDYEMYDLENNPNDPEVTNLAYNVDDLSGAQKAEYDRLKAQLEKVKKSLGIETKG